MLQGLIAGCFVENILCQLHGLSGDMLQIHVCECGRCKQAICLAAIYRDVPFSSSAEFCIWSSSGLIHCNTAMLEYPWYVGSPIPDSKHKWRCAGVSRVLQGTHCMRRRSAAGSHRTSRLAPNLAAADTISPTWGTGSWRASHMKRSRSCTLLRTASCRPVHAHQMASAMAVVGHLAIAASKRCLI